MSNPFLDELLKIANDMSDEPMNPDNQPGVTEQDVIDAQIQNEEEMLAAQETDVAREDIQPSEEEIIDEIVDEAIDEEIAARGGDPLGHSPNPDVVAQAEQGIPQEEEALIAAMEEEQLAHEIRDVLLKEAAEEIFTLATLAKIAQCAKGGESVPEELQKEASYLINQMSQGEDAYYTVLEKVATELFGVEENVEDLFSAPGLHMVFEQLASLNEEGLDKQADENSNALVRLKGVTTDFIANAKQKVMEAANSAIHLKEISAELDQASKELSETTNAFTNGGFTADELLKVPAQDHAHLNQLVANKTALEQQRRVGMGVRGAGMGIAAAGAAYGGKKLYDHMNAEQGEEKVAGVLPDAFSGGTLNAVQENDYTGGIKKMSKELVNDFLKVAGAAGLVSIANDENQDFELRKEASEAFDEIAKMSHTDMTENLVKVAQQIYSEDELHEIVAGHHTDTLIEKVAYFVDAVDASYDEVFEKTANAGGVAAVKNMGAGLVDAAKNVVNVIGQKKEQAQGATRDYIGALKGGAPYSKGVAAAGTATGLAGGGLVGAGAMAGYNALKNPQEYNIEQTAAAYEEAVLAKQAAVEAYAHADAFTKSFQHLFN